MSSGHIKQCMRTKNTGRDCYFIGRATVGNIAPTASSIVCEGGHVTDIVFKIWGAGVCTEFPELCNSCSYAISCVISLGLLKQHVGTYFNEVHPIVRNNH
jgi:hypothetical protein